jgi:crotonobetainyl-CoA:carnitine CoA-transferase CaiB-like acyl-CoA transferase
LEAIMKRNTSLHTNHQLDQLAGQFEHWRQTRTHARDRIPPALWEQAVALARVIPHSRVAQHLRLSANDLKKQMAMTHPATPPQAPLPLSFVEVPTTPQWPTPPMATQVELHRADGARLCIHNAESTLPLTALVRAFLEAPSCCS